VEQSAKSAEKRNFTEEFKAGQRYIFQNSAIAMIIVLAALLGFFGFPFGQQIPALARDVLKTVADTEANVASRTSLLYAFQGVGALIGAFSLASFHGLKRKGLVMVIGQFTFIAALISISFIRSTPLALAFILILGWGMVTQLNLMNTLIQINVPDNLRGRVFSTYLWALQGVAPFGSLVIGWMAQSWGIPSTALACGVICLFGAGLVHLSNPAVRKMTA
jgi:predicted MFS family arabinose efflux permease